MIKMVGFDLDGTLGDTIPLCLKAFQQAVAPYVGHVPGEDEIRRTFGINEEGMIRAFVNVGWEQAYRDYLTVYESLHDCCGEPFTGIFDLLELLMFHDVRLALITGKGEPSCRITLRRFQLEEFFPDLETGRADRPCKTEAMVRILDNDQLGPDEFCYIGDDIADVYSVRNAGVRCL